MIYVTGDTHGDQARFFYTDGPLKDRIRPEFCGLIEDDVLIVAGDFGFVWDESPERAHVMEQLSTLPFQLCFVDGNHENFPLIESYPQEIWCGGKVHRIGPNIYHLMRGEIFEIQEKRIFVFGGAASTDRDFRVQGESWWPQELPCQAEYDQARENLFRKAGAIDYVITHTCPGFLIPLMGHKPYAPDLQLTAFLSDVATLYAKEFKGWFFGHWHIDKSFHGGRYQALNFDVVPLSQAPELTDDFSSCFIDLPRTFQTFQVGPANYDAFSAAKTVAAHPGQLTPLILSGPSSVGKTHLLKSIQRSIHELYPDQNVIYVVADYLISEMIQALIHHTLKPMIQKYTSADVLLIDDLQFILPRETTLNRLLQIFEMMHRGNAQLVLTLDEPLNQFPRLESWMQEHFPPYTAIDMNTDPTVIQAILMQLTPRLQVELSEDEFASMIQTEHNAAVRSFLLKKKLEQELGLSD